MKVDLSDSLNGPLMNSSSKKKIQRVKYQCVKKEIAKDKLQQLE